MKEKAIGFRVTPSEIFYSIVVNQKDEYEFISISSLKIPVAIDEPKKLSFIRNTVSTILLQYNIDYAGIKLTEGNARSGVKNNSLNLLCKTYNYDDDTLDRVKYGLEIIYISITKLTFLLICSIIFKTFKETLIFSFFISFIRNYSYGIHAKKSWQCYVSSFIVFIIFPFAVIKINLPFLFKIIICLFSLISMILYAPAANRRYVQRNWQSLSLQVFSD